MSPVLAIGYVFNLIIIKGSFGWLGLILTVLISGGVYFAFSKNAGDNKKYIAQIAALGIGFLAGIFAVGSASWGNDGFTVAAIILEPLVFFLFLFLGKR